MRMSICLLMPLLCLMTCSFQGCTVGPKYERPVIDMPVAWREESRDTNSIADIHWGEFFRDEDLLSLIKVALENNKDMLIAAARIEEARGAYRATYGEELPIVDVFGTAGRSRSSREISPSARSEDDFQVGGQTGWEMDIWGRLRHSSSAARAELLATEEGYRAVVLTLVSDVAILYFDIQDLDRQLEVTAQTISSRQESLEQAKKRFSGGLTSELEVKQADSELASAQAIMPRLRYNLRLKENTLSVLLGQPPAATPRGRDRKGVELPAVVQAGLPNELIRRRPDVMQSEQELIAACHRIGVAEASFRPSLSLTGIIGQEAPDFSTLFNSQATLWSAVASTTAPILSFGRLEGRRDAARARFEQAKLQYEQTILIALREVNNALSAYNQSMLLREAQEYLVKANQDYANLALAIYENGEVGYLDYLDARRKRFDAELSLSQAIRDQFVALVSVYKALGGGWEMKQE